jgi:hypothetical protein
MSELMESHDGPRDEDYQRKRSASFLHALLAAPALSLGAFALAVGSLLGVYALSGSTYLGVATDNGGDPTRSGLVQVDLLGAAFAGLIILLSYRAWRHADESGPSWAQPLALAATLVAFTSMAGRLVIALLHSQGHGPTSGYLF